MREHTSKQMLEAEQNTVPSCRQSVSRIYDWWTNQSKRLIALIGICRASTPQQHG